MIEQEFHAAISAEKPTSVHLAPTLNVSAPLIDPSQKSPEKKLCDDAECGGSSRKRLSAISTQVVGAINDVEILETTFGVSFFLGILPCVLMMTFFKPILC